MGTAESSNDDKTFAVYCIIIATGKGVPRKPRSNHCYYCVCVCGSLQGFVQVILRYRYI